MIRVNLLRNQAASLADFNEVVDPNKVALKNLFIISLLTLILFLYEYQNISGLKSSLNQLNIQSQQLLAQVEEKKIFSEEAKKLQTQLVQVKERLQIIRSLSKNRFIELKSLDLLQSILPDRVWFDRLTYGNKKFEIEAVAVEIEDVTLMKTAMDNQDSFKNVSIKNTKETTIKENTVNAFTLSFDIEELK
ncbi:MAG: PilN domain-containing protein [Bdellovibrionaceae bacterium]|nr:PilN domain-containing protein [Pseudobdellovibrionaceae bacterium]